MRLAGSGIGTAHILSSAKASSTHGGAIPQYSSMNKKWRRRHSACGAIAWRYGADLQRNPRAVPQRHTYIVTVSATSLKSAIWSKFMYW